MIRILRMNKVARAIGRQRYADALVLLQQMIAVNQRDFFALAMSSQCASHLGDEILAIEYATKALEVDPHNFDLIALLAHIYSKRNQNDLAYLYAGKLLCVPEDEDSAKYMHFFSRLLGFVAKVFRNARTLAEQFNEGLETQRKSREEWMKWAREYMNWYEAQNNSRMQAANDDCA